MRSLKLPVAVRKAVKSIIGPEIIRYVRHVGISKVQDFNKYQHHLAGRSALEIGGPSEIFDYDGSLPVYPNLASVDNCLFSSDTMWTGKVNGSFYYDASRREGVQYIAEATNLTPVVDANYECVLASHCLEHLANPLKALHEFRRVLEPDGLLLAILPHKDATFDWRRPVTSLRHIQEDFARNVTEDDLTHLPEVLALHDMNKDDFGGTRAEFEERCRHNGEFRIMHHHTFNTGSAVAFVESAGFTILHFETVKPYHIIILAQRVSTPGNV